MNKKYTVLIIDDKKENLKYLNEILKDENYIIKATTDAKFAIESSKLDSPDLILLDIKMPELSGFEVCNILKDDIKLKDIPIIFISALDDIDSKVKAFSQGGVDYITKPFEEEEVKARIKTQINIFEKKQIIENLLVQQDFFLKKIIHEMNTPLSIISLNINNLESKFGFQDEFEVIKASSKSLSSIYNDLYYLTKKEKKTSCVENIELTNFLSSRAMFFDEMAKVKDIFINFEIGESFTISMDKNDLERVVDNTISNAIKYSNSDSQIDIILNKGYLEIRDYGIGINDISSVFNAYYQQKKKNIGLGLGLNIVKDICDNYDIKIDVKSHKEGTSFCYKFPIKMIKEH